MAAQVTGDVLALCSFAHLLPLTEHLLWGPVLGEAHRPGVDGSFQAIVLDVQSPQMTTWASSGPEPTGAHPHTSRGPRSRIHPD